ncbi:LOW QUALITY PROTEIN: Rieske domain-containing protein, partial [Micromonospora sp. ATCC 39149]
RAGADRAGHADAARPPRRCRGGGRDGRPGGVRQRRQGRRRLRADWRGLGDRRGRRLWRAGQHRRHPGRRRCGVRRQGRGDHPARGRYVQGFDPICTTRPAHVDGGTINCTCHNSKFSITDGSVTSGPATKALAAKELKVDGDRISLA